MLLRSISQQCSRLWFAAETEVKSDRLENCEMCFCWKVERYSLGTKLERTKAWALLKWWFAEILRFWWKLEIWSSRTRKKTVFKRKIERNFRHIGNIFTSHSDEQNQTGREVRPKGIMKFWSCNGLVRIRGSNRRRLRYWGSIWGHRII